MAPARTTKRRRVSPPGDEERGSKSSGGASASDFYSNAAEWDLEQDYEQRPRKLGKKDKEQTRLPIKTAEGLQNVAEPEPEAEAEDSDSFLGTDDDEDMEDADSDEDEEEVEEEKPKIPLKLQIIQTKEELARLATLINEDPEENMPLFKTMAEIMERGEHVAIKKLALAAQAAVYKDVIPGYRIRPLGDEDLSAKISKEVRKLRTFEQSLLSNYKHYIQKLVELTKPAKKDGPQVDPGLKSIAINCACNLLLSVAHFNFRGELLKILVNRLARKQVDADFVKCRETMEEVFIRDEDGVVSLEAVRLLSKMMKAKEFRINETVLDTFLHLRLLSEFSRKASRDRIDREEEEETPQFGKKPKQKREFRTKRERKVQKERKAVEKDMKEADALVSHEERDKNQAETLKLVFGVYFRILKLRIPKLMGPVLEGLAKYAHLINQDFFGDLLEALKDLIGHADRAEEEEEEEETDETNEAEPATTRDAQREALLCTVTAFALLEGQDASKAASTLHLDLSFFVKHLYRSLYNLSINPDVEFNPDKSLRLPDPNSPEANPAHRSRKKVNFQTPMVLLLRCLQSTLISRAHGMPPPVRLGSFSKRLMTSSLQLPEKSALATLSLMNQVAKHNARRISSLWHSDERKGDGVFNAYATDIEATNVFAGTIWEGELLRQHYCPQVRDAALDVEKMIATRK
ncbi:nuclear export protein Noc3 [Aspergillus eucalypticola CBS 122712]|uniref:Nucleolar complex-associated protein 3 n=1 Tax=Aspergillus eucalypticola (strain CBS 122712 / IBT 29274) TaxID=1448314 RepID=A0A317VBF3_ASPEC|nr:nuclear export protein Noc3 [Aspergillus eucalypticola CBS 122712]PWY70709.1 nuclear export protein Noc3 [Aspergillus eucalypticola CBS 122712]